MDLGNNPEAKQKEKIMKTVKMPVKLLITVKRPNGVIETKVHPTLKTISQSNFEIMKKATKEAGKGEIISFEVVYENKNVMTSKAEMLNAGNDNTVDNMSRMGE